MTDLTDYGIDLPTLQEMYREWSEMKVPKSIVEQRYLGTRRHHGKLFSKLVWQHLGIRTEGRHPMRERIDELEATVGALRSRLAELGVSDDEIDTLIRDALDLDERRVR